MIQPSKHQPESRVIAPISNLQNLWESGGFALTAQLPPVFTAQPEDLIERVAALTRGLDAVLVAGAPDGAVALSTVALAVLLQRAGLSVIVQLSGRDKNRLALQSEILSLGALKIPNALVDTRPIGRASLGQNSDARLVTDLDGPALLATAVRLRDEARFISGASVKTPPVFYLGASVSLEDPPFTEKLTAAQFLVTEPLSDLQRLSETLPPFLATGADLLQTRPLLVSVPLLANSRGKPDDLDGNTSETSRGTFIATINLLKRSPGVRGCNVVIADFADLAELERVASSGLFHLERRE